MAPAVIAGRADRLALRASLLASVLVFSLAGVARAESVAVSVEPPPHLAKPIGVEVSGAADGLHRLFAFVLPWGEACPWDSAHESFGFAPESPWLTSAEGVALSPGAFSLNYSFSTSQRGASVCAYLAGSLKEEPDASDFAYVSWPVEAPYPVGGTDELKRIAVEEEEREQREARESRERQERERSPATETEGTAAAVTVGCTVPYLVGHTFSGARSLLIRAHCRVGKVHKPANRHGRLLVVRQGRRRGAKLAANTPIAIYLQPPT